MPRNYRHWFYTFEQSPWEYRNIAKPFFELSKVNPDTGIFYKGLKPKNHWYRAYKPKTGNSKT